MFHRADGLQRGMEQRTKSKTATSEKYPWCFSDKWFWFVRFLWSAPVVETVILNKSEVCSITSFFPCETITFTSFQQILGTAALLILLRPTPTCYGNYVDDKCLLGESGLKRSDALDWWRKCQRDSTGDDDRLRVGDTKEIHWDK